MKKVYIIATLLLIFKLNSMEINSLRSESLGNLAVLPEELITYIAANVDTIIYETRDFKQTIKNIFRFLHNIRLLNKKFKYLIDSNKDQILKEISSKIKNEYKNIDNMINIYNMSLTYEIVKGNFNLVKLLIYAGANVNVTDFWGGNALIYAAKKGYADMVKLLIEHKADINSKITKKYESMRDSIQASLEAASSNKLNMWKQHDILGNTALMIAVLYGHYDTVKLLIDAGADLNLQNELGYTALMIAAVSGRKEIAELLIASGSKLDLKDKYNNTALLLAVEYGRKDIIELLLINDADINLQNKVGFTALMKAIIIGDKDIVILLLDYGADVDFKKNKYGETAYNLAARISRKDIVELLNKRKYSLDRCIIN